MPLFICDNCGVIENTALGMFWDRYYKNEPVLCSECGKGKWHGRFEKQTLEEYMDKYPNGASEIKNLTQPH